LQFGPIKAIRRQIGRIIESKHEYDSESDEEVIKDNRDYEQAIKQYKIFAEKERSLKAKKEKKCSLQVKNEMRNATTNTLDGMLIFISPLKGDDKFAMSVANTTTKNVMQSLDIEESSIALPSNNFRIFDDEDKVLWNTDEPINQRKRKSRSAGIAHQKRTSVRILSEMLHTLDFIERYNHKSEVMQDVLTEVANEDIRGEGKGQRVNKISIKKENAEQWSTKKTSIDHHARLANSKFQIKIKPAFVTLSPDSLIQSYKTLQRRFQSFHHLDGNGDIENVQKEIRHILDKDSLIEEFFGDVEIIAEEKNLARCIRGYSNKADQEKIEKRNFEEQQKLRLHEYQYYQTRRRKKSPLEIEWKEMEERSIHYVRDSASLLTKTDNSCNFKPNCTICDLNALDGGHSCESTIFSPRFRQIENSICMLSRIESNGEHLENACPCFDLSSKCQALVSSLSLLELYHTLDFIKNYNSGMIVSRKNRK